MNPTVASRCKRTPGGKSNYEDVFTNWKTFIKVFFLLPFTSNFPSGFVKEGSILFHITQLQHLHLVWIWNALPYFMILFMLIDLEPLTSSSCHVENSSNISFSWHYPHVQASQLITTSYWQRASWSQTRSSKFKREFNTKFMKVDFIIYFLSVFGHVCILTTRRCRRCFNHLLLKPLALYFNCLL